MQPNPYSLPHSGLGIASFIVSLVAGFDMLAIVGIAGVAEATQAGGLDETSPAAVGLGLLLLFTVPAQLVALGLGIAGLVQSGRSKLFGVLGTVFASTALLASLLLLMVSAAQ